MKLAHILLVEDCDGDAAFFFIPEAPPQPGP